MWNNFVFKDFRTLILTKKNEKKIEERRKYEEVKKTENSINF